MFHFTAKVITQCLKVGIGLGRGSSCRNPITPLQTGAVLWGPHLLSLPGFALGLNCDFFTIGPQSEHPIVSHAVNLVIYSWFPGRRLCIYLSSLNLKFQFFYLFFSSRFITILLSYLCVSIQIYSS